MHKFATICLAGALCFSFSGIRAEASSLSLAEEGIASVMTEAQTADPDADEKVLEDMTPSEFEGVCIAKVNDYVNVRSEANEDSEVLGKLYDKSAGTVDGEENGWYKITSGSVTGYVKADYVVTGDAAEELAKEVGKRVATVTTQTLRVRTDATTDASVLGLIGEGEELTVTITSEKLYALGLNSVNTLKITVTDGKGGTAYRRVTFKRTNSAPTISGQDKALGLKNGSFAENYTVSDVEGDNVVVTEFVDDVQIRSYQATLGQQETIELTREKWLSLTNGQHQLRIEAVDGNFATSVRVFSFSKKETVIKFELVAPEETDAAATKVLVTPTWKIEGAVAKVEACNNGFDAVPTWEDITAMVQINRVYNFTNKTKTASKWGVNIRFTITKNEGFEGEVSISGFGGAYE